VSLWGCAAVASLAHKNRINQSRLSPVCNYLADILEAHYKSRAVTKEACRAITALCHMNIANRNKMGAAEVCAFLPKAMLQHIDDADVAIWSVRAVADLAANHPNNQTKLGGKGTCEGLIKVLKGLVNSSSSSSKTRVVDDSALKDNVSLAKWTCWAIGNIVQVCLYIY
jgi:hypothetical protein